MLPTVVIGVDPGIVHTGVVMLEFDHDNTQLGIGHAVVDGPDAQATYDACHDLVGLRWPDTVDVFIEKYRPRSGFDTNQDMITANSTFKQALHGKLMQNTGVKKIISRELMELFDLWSWPTPTHHDDLRSAARIAMLGMLLDKQLNRVIYDYVIASIEGKDWYVKHNG